MNDTISADVDFSGTKTFDTFPSVTDSTPISALADDALVTKRFLDDMAHSVGYIGEASIVSAAPNQTAGFTDDYENLYHWNIDAGGRDSSEYMQGGSMVGSLVLSSSGNLVVYGWLADNGDVAPENCWVGLFGKIQTTSGPQYTALQIQPWIAGPNSRVAQYVSFNVPVRRGLETKIVTGFNVNGSPTGFGRAQTLMAWGDSGTKINEFVGYVIQ